MDILSILQHLLGQSKKSAHNNCRENYAFFCPFCKHHKPKLEIDIVSGNWHCWKCDRRGRSPYSLAKQINASPDILEQLRRRYSSKSNPRTPGKVLETNNVTLPAEYLQFNIASGSHLQRLALTFLKNRHITPEDISRYRIGYCEHGMYSDKIIIPNYNDSAQLDYWIGRSYNPNTEFKFSAPSNEKNVIGFELLISWQFPIVLCEGALDAIAIRRNAIPLYGKTISRKLKERIINERPPKIYIALDRDAYREMLAICEYFISNGLNVYAVELDGKDPSEIGYDRFWKLATDAIPITARSIFEMKLKMIL